MLKDLEIKVKSKLDQEARYSIMFQINNNKDTFYNKMMFVNWLKYNKLCSILSNIMIL